MFFLFICDIILFNVDLYFKRNEIFKDLFFSIVYVSYIDIKNDISVFECVGSCVYCVGFLYYSELRICYLLEIFFNEISFNSSYWDVGWEFYESVNGMLKMC